LEEPSSRGGKRKGEGEGCRGKKKKREQGQCYVHLSGEEGGGRGDGQNLFAQTIAFSELGRGKEEARLQADAPVRFDGEGKWATNADGRTPSSAAKEGRGGGKASHDGLSLLRKKGEGGGESSHLYSCFIFPQTAEGGGKKEEKKRGGEKKEGILNISLNLPTTLLITSLLYSQ